MRNMQQILTGLALIGLMAGHLGGAADDSDSHPFATHHYVIQVSQADPERWTLALNNVHNLLEHYGPSDVEIVVVTYGPGLRMLLQDSQVAQRVQSVAAEGVEFDACQNTIKGMEKQLGHALALNSAAKLVPAGVVRIGELEGKGFAYLKP
jgi:intracellular sulfur oxidation DsrE/DsrF family protein